jgi:uracil-DNA glycosylase
VSGPQDVREQALRQLQFFREMGVSALDLSSVGIPQSEPGAGEPAHTGVVPGAALEDLRSGTIGDCRRCKLCEGRTKIVFGDGSPRARLMFIGEGPGADEDRQGLPFVGRAGQLLNQIIKAMGFTREEVYIANVVKCRPPDNRAPQPDETASCTPFLFRQIEIIGPEVIVALGSPATQALLGTSAGITKIRGTFREFQGIPVMPTFHPAYLLRNPAAKKEVWEDMQQVMARLKS